MIRRNNPAIDVEELERRVREAAAAVEAGGALSGPPPAPPGLARDAVERSSARLRLVGELLDDVEHRLEIAAERALPRTEIPRRFARRGPLAIPLRALVRLFNYAFKTQREVDVEQNAALLGLAYALRETSSVQRLVAEYVLARLDERGGD